jgi:hypothetical protein
MKHLRKFNESSVEDIKSNIEDILSELSDRYIPVDVFLSTVVCQKVCSIQLGDEYADRDMISIVPKDNKDEFLRVYDYMESEGYDFSSISYDSSGVSGDIVTLRIVDIGLGIDAFSNHLFNGIDETCYLKLFFRKIEK